MEWVFADSLISWEGTAKFFFSLRCPFVNTVSFTLPHGVFTGVIGGFGPFDGLAIASFYFISSYVLVLLFSKGITGM